MLADALAIPLKLATPRKRYKHGWGTNCADAREVIVTWYLTINDRNGNATTLPFDLVEGRSPLILGLDVKQYSNTLNRQDPPVIEFQRPSDTAVRQFEIYQAKDEDGNPRLRVSMVPHQHSSVRSLLANGSARQDLNLVRRLHRYTHWNSHEMKQFLQDAGQLTAERSRICQKIQDECDVCASSGRPAIRNKISMTHINQQFNEEVQVDFTVAYIAGEKYEIFNIIDLGTGYGERSIAASHGTEQIIQLIETTWLYRHGAPGTLSADPEFGHDRLKAFLATHNIHLAARPSRSSHKNGHIERNNGTFKSVLEKLSKERTNDTPATLVSRASMITNLLHGSSTLSSFQLARGFTPSILGMPKSKVSQEMLDAHIELTATRALQRLLRNRAPSRLPPSALTQGQWVYVFYKTSKQNVRVEWVEAQVVRPLQHYVECRRSGRGPLMRVAYEHLRIKPQSALAQDMAKKSLEDELADIRFMDKMEEGDEASKSDDEIMRQIFGDEEVGALFSKTEPIGDAAKDIGDVQTDAQQDDGQLRSQAQQVLEQVYDTVGGEQLTRRRMECAPTWILDQAMRKEIEDNWEGAIERIPEKDVPRHANVISSHIIYKVKQEEGHKRMKARLCPHGNRDKLRGHIRKDSATARFNIIRIILSLATLFDFSIACADIKGAYLHSGPITRQLYVRPPKELDEDRGILWRLIKMPYGISEAGRQWAKAFESWLLNEAGFERISGISQLFIMKTNKGHIKLIMAKIVDDLLIAGRRADIDAFIVVLQGKFPTRKVLIDQEAMFNGCVIRRDTDGGTILDMTAYRSNMKPVHIEDGRKANRALAASDSERDQYRRLAGEMVWLGSGTMPQAAVVGSIMQQKLPHLKVEDIIEANHTLKELCDLDAYMVFAPVSSKIIKAKITTYSDAAFNITSSTAYGQTGVIIGLKMTLQDHNVIIHMLDWHSGKQRRISHSSYGAEILACSDADDRGFYMKECLQSIVPQAKIQHELVVDSKGLYDTITTLHDGKEYRLRQTVQRIRDSFENGDIDQLRWVQGSANIADVLTKRNPQMHTLLNRIMTTGKFAIPRHQTSVLDSATWK